MVSIKGLVVCKSSFAGPRRDRDATGAPGRPGTPWHAPERPWDAPAPGDAPRERPRDADAPEDAPGDASGDAFGDALGDAPGDAPEPVRACPSLSEPVRPV